MKAIAIASALMMLSFAAFAAPTTEHASVTGVVEVAQPPCDCAPIVTLVDGEARTLVSAPHPYLKQIAKQAGKPVTIEGTLETYKNEKTGVTKHVIAVAAANK